MLSADPRELRHDRDRNVLLGLLLFVAVAVVGLYMVKWHPYYGKSFLAADKHSIGNSIVSGTAATAPTPSWSAAWSYTLAYGKSIWQALIVGLLLGSGVQVLLPRTWLLRVLGRTNGRSMLTAGIAAVPSMMCTCCSAPLAVGLAKSKAGVGPTLAYWLGNPILNPATMIFMGFVLGWKWVGLRIAVGLVLVFGVAYLADRWISPKQVPTAAVDAEAKALSQPDEQGNLFIRWAKAFFKLCVGLLPEYLVLVVLLGAARAWLFPQMDPTIGHSVWLLFALAITGTLFVIPTAGEIPIVQVLTSYGLGAGGAAALLTVLPPVSLPSLVMVGRAMHAKTLTFVAASVAVLGVLSGFAALALGF